jgi:hypothetical protein
MIYLIFNSIIMKYSNEIMLIAFTGITLVILFAFKSKKNLFYFELY